MPISVPNVPIPDRSTLPFNNSEELKLKILSELNALVPGGGAGWIVDARPRVVIRYGRPEEMAGEYELTVRNLNVPGQSFFSIVSGGTNETVLERAGRGRYLTRGQLYPSTEYGIPRRESEYGLLPEELERRKEEEIRAGVTRVAEGQRPWEPGITAFAAKISTAFGRYMRYSQEGERQNRFSVQEIYTWLRGVTNPEGVQREAPVPGGDTTIPGRVAGSATYLGDLEAERNVTRQTRMLEFLVAKGADVQKAATALENQIRDKGVTGWWQLLKGGYVKEPTATKALTLIPAGSAGTFAASGEVYGLTGKEEKQKYVEGLRQESKYGIAVGEKGQQRLEMLPEELQTTARIGLRTGEKFRRGFLSDIIYATQDVPLQSGSAQVRLNQPVREYITDKGGLLMAGYESGQRYEIEAKNLSDFTESPIQMRQRLLNLKLEQGQRYYFTNQPREMTEKGGERLAYTPSSQMEYITGYSAILPHRWREGLSEEEAAIQMQTLAQKGFTEISWGANENPIISPIIYEGTAGSQKRYFKAQIDVPLASVDYTLKTRQGNLPYDVLAPMAKYMDVAVESLLEGMTEGTDVERLISTLFQDKPEVAGAIVEMQAQKVPLTLEEIGKRSKLAPTGEEFLKQVTTRLIEYPDQERLLKDFGVGVVEGRAPIAQMTHETYKEMRAMLLSQLYMSGQIGKTEAGEYDINAAKPFLRTLRKNVRWDKEKQLYTLSTEQKWLRGKFLMSMTPETSGVGAVNDILSYLEADRGAAGVKDWVKSVFPDIFPETPASYSAKKVVEAFEGSQAGRPTRLSSAITVTPDMAHRMRMAIIAEQNLREGQGESIDDLKKMDIIARQMKSVAGVEENQPEPLYHFEEAGTMPGFVAAGGGIFRALESERHRLEPTGELEAVSQARVATRFNRYMQGLLLGAETGEGDYLAREYFAGFQEKYIDSDLINKIKGGIMARAGASYLLKPRETFISEQAMRRYFTLQGGRGWGKEWQQYRGLMQDSTMLRVRYPAPNVGTEGMPGSVLMSRTITPNNPVGQRIMDLYRREGIMPPEMITSAFYGAGIEDADRDPYTGLPTVVKTRDRGWVRYQGGGDMKEYMKWVRGLSGSQSRQEQEATFMGIFQGTAGAADPFAVSTMNWAANVAGIDNARARGILAENLFGKRLGTKDYAARHLQAGRDWNIHKMIGMGKTYNVYRRLVGASLTQMGYPTDLIQRTTDIGIAPYQHEIDFESMNTFLEELVNTSGFRSATNPQGLPDVAWGVNTGGREFFKWDTNVWNPATQNLDYLVETGAVGLSARPNVPSEWIAALSMNLPERKEGVSEEAYNELIRDRVRNLSAEIEAVRNPEGLTPLSKLQSQEEINLRTLGLANFFAEKRKTGDIGAQSPMGLMALWRGVRNYFDKQDLVEQNAIRAGFRGRGIQFGPFSLDFEEARNLTEPLDVLFSHLKKIRGPKALHKNLSALHNVFGAFNKLGIQNRPMVQGLYRVFGKAAGIERDEQGNFIVPDAMNVIDSIRDITKSFQGGRGELVERLKSIRQWNFGTPLRASALSYEDEYMGNPEFGAIGTRLHSYTTDYLKYAKEQGETISIGGEEREISEVEHQMGNKLLTGKLDLSVKKGGGEEILEAKFTEPSATPKFIKQLSGYRFLREEENVPVVGGGVLWMGRNTGLDIEQQELEAAGIAKDTPYEDIPIDVRRRIGKRIVGGFELKEKWSAEELGPQTLLTSVAEWMVGRNIPFGANFAAAFLERQRQRTKEAPAVLEQKRAQGRTVAREATPAATVRQESVATRAPVTEQPITTETFVGGAPPGIIYGGGFPEGYDLEGDYFEMGQLSQKTGKPLKAKGYIRALSKGGQVVLGTPRAGVPVAIAQAAAAAQEPIEGVQSMAELGEELRERGRILNYEDAMAMLPPELRAPYLELLERAKTNPRRWQMLKNARFNKAGLATSWQFEQADVERLIGRVGGDEGGFTFEPGRIMNTYRNLPTMLGQLFTGDERQSVAESETPEIAWTRTQELLEAQNRPIGKAIKAVPGLWRAVQGMKGLGSQYQQLVKSRPELQELASSLPGGSWALKMLDTLFAGGSQGTDALNVMNAAQLPGTELSNAFATLGNIGAKAGPGGGAGRVGDMPVSEASATIGQRWIKYFDDMTRAIDNGTKSVMNYKDRQVNLNETMQIGMQLQDKHLERFQRYESAYKEAILKRDELAAQLTEKAGKEIVGRQLTREELAEIAPEGQPLTADVRRALQQYGASEVDVSLARRRMVGAALEPEKPVPGEEGFGTGDMGRMARRMLGGFGLMYMRSIFGIATQPLQRGYQEALGYQQAAETAVGGAFGGVVPMINPEEYNARVAAMSGGVGWAGIRTAQANLFRKQPGIEALAGGLEAGIAGFGATAWLSTLAEGTGLGTFLGAAAPVIGLGIGLGSMYAGAIGAAAEPDRQAVALYQKVLAGSMRLQKSIQGEQTVGPVGVLNAFDKNYLGFALQAGPLFETAGKTMQNINVFESMRKYQAGGGTDLRGFLLKTGYSPQQANTYMAQYGQAQIGAYPNIAVEGLLGAQNLQQIFGTSLTYGTGGTYELLATGVAQGIPYQQAAMAAAQTPFRSYEEQKAAANKMIETWLARGGLTMEQAALVTEGGARYASLGTMAPAIPVEQSRLFREMPPIPVPLTGEDLSRYFEREYTRPEDRTGMRGYAARYHRAIAGAGTAAAQEAEFKEKMGALPTAVWQIWSARADIERQKQLMNLPYTTPQAQEYFKPWTQQMIIQGQQQIQAEAPRITAMTQIFQGMQQLGAPTTYDMSQYQKLTLGQLEQIYASTQTAEKIQTGLLNVGMPTARATAWGEAIPEFMAKEPMQAKRLLAALGGDQMAWAAIYAKNPKAWAENMPLSLPGYGGATIPMGAMGFVDYRETIGPGGQYQGTPTGMPWGTTSLAYPGATSAQAAGQIFGQGWATDPRFSKIGGYIGALISGGQFAGQAWQIQDQARYAQASAGLQMQQIALQMAFQTGVGIDKYAGTINPQTGAPFGFNTGKWSWNVPGVGGFTSQGGGMWGAEDAMRALSYAQQQWGFGQQREQLAMNARFFQQNLGMNIQQSQMQRGWTREDWAYQDQMRGMQWGWRQEDFQENLRFMTGRERRLAERQMRRETILYGAEGEQIDKQKSRQEELWKLEDERFRIQAQQYQEQKKFQEEAIKTQEKFFEERKKLEEEQVKMQRAYMVQQMELQKQQAGLAADQAAKQSQLADAMMLVSQFSQIMTASGQLFNEESINAILEDLSKIYPALADLFKKWLDMANTGIGGSGPPPPGKNFQCSFCKEWFATQKELSAHIAAEHQKQYGGLITAGESAIVGEAGPEIRVPYFTEQIIPLHKFDPYQHGMPVGARERSNASPQVVHLVINLANKLFKEFIVDVIDQELDV